MRHMDIIYNTTAIYRLYAIRVVHYLVLVPVFLPANSFIRLYIYGCLRLSGFSLASVVSQMNWLHSECHENIRVVQAQYFIGNWKYK